MSYWFAKPHTLVLVRARIDLRNPRKRDRLRAKSEAAFDDRALALSSMGWKCCSGVSLVSGQTDQYLPRARCHATELSFVGSAVVRIHGGVEGFDQS